MVLDKRVTRKIPQYEVGVELIGDWFKVKNLIDGLDKTIAVGTTKAQLSASRKLLTIVKRNIRENGGSIGWPPVSDRYKRYKTNKGYDPDNLLFMTGLYYRSINIWNTKNNYYIGVKRRLKHPGKKGSLTIGEIATVLEYGSMARNIKARPLWGPSYKQLGGNNRVKNLIVWHIRNEIYTKYNVRAKISIL